MKQLVLLFAFFISYALSAQNDSLILYLGDKTSGSTFNNEILLRVKPYRKSSNTYSVFGYRLYLPLRNVRGPNRTIIGTGNELTRRDIAAIERLASGSELRITAVVQSPGQKRKVVTATYKIP